ncbi:MAG: amino acid--tRNA ligase-related protein [Candidatus Aenigmatarchaeota archaeon]
MTSTQIAEARFEQMEDEKLNSVIKIEAELLKGARAYFDTNGFTEMVVPHITRATGSCENMDTLFSLDFFGRQAYLRQTGQLYLESFVPRLGRVFCVGSSFRAEPTVDERHLTEFTLLEIEHPGDLKELMGHIEGTIFSMIQFVLKNKKKELEILGVDQEKLKKITIPFKKITYKDAIDILSLEWGDDLKSSHEAQLVKHFGDRPLFVTHYPKEIKFFNMKTNKDDPKVVNSTDLLLPHSGESVGSAEREHEHDELIDRLTSSYMFKQLEKKGGSLEDFGWYLEILKKGSIPHSGCGFGLNRITQFILETKDIRHSTAFPQNRENLI